MRSPASAVRVYVPASIGLLHFMLTISFMSRALTCFVFALEEERKQLRSRQLSGDLFFAHRRGPARARQGEEATLLSENVRERLTIVSLGQQDISARSKRLLILMYRGSAISHPLLAHCAPKPRAQALYTWNKKDFV
jgi:hypothetical protein